MLWDEYGLVGDIVVIILHFSLLFSSLLFIFVLFFLPSVVPSANGVNVTSLASNSGPCATTANLHWWQHQITASATHGALVLHYLLWYVLPIYFLIISNLHPALQFQLAWGQGESKGRRLLPAPSICRVSSVMLKAFPVRFPVMAQPSSTPNGNSNYPIPTPTSSGDYVSASSTSHLL